MDDQPARGEQAVALGHDAPHRRIAGLVDQDVADDQIEAFILEAGLPDRTAEIAALREAAMPFGAGGSAPKIVEIVAADFERGAGVDAAGQGLGPSVLVDPSTVTETAWERQPGREPIND